MGAGNQSQNHCNSIIPGLVALDYIERLADCDPGSELSSIVSAVTSVNGGLLYIR